MARTKISKNAALVFAVSLIASCYHQQAWGQNDSDQRVLVDLPELPEPFTNDKLPSKGNAAAIKEKCYNMMGCFEEIPINSIPQNPMTLKTEFRLYHRETENIIPFGRYENCLRDKPDECERYPFNLQALLDSPFVVTRRTIVIIGGYFSKAPSSWELHLKDLWTQLDDVNIIVLSWVGGNSGLYQTAAANTRPVARQLTVLMYYLAKLKGGRDLPDLDLGDDVFAEKFYLIGHSLGAHIAAFVGQDLSGRVGRITGLDPAGPSFDVLDRRFRVDRSDAQLVDILHTNAGSKIFTRKTQYGSALASGHIDLWANDGVHQPGCINEMLGCSHKRATKIYEAFLNHQLSMKNFLPGAEAPGAGQMYRLSAFLSNNFDEFHNGTSLASRCPVTALDDTDLRMPDIGQCSIPVDYVGWFDVVRRELETQHGVDFSPVTELSSTPVPRNYYYYTTSETGDQFDHYLIRVRVSRWADAENRGKKEGDDSNLQEASARDLFDRGACDIALELEMSSGLKTSYTVKKYRLLDGLAHLEIVLPYLSPTIVSKYEIAKLDRADYLIARSAPNAKDAIPSGDLEHVRDSVAKIFPSLVSLRGLGNERDQSSAGTSRRGKGILSTIARFFDFANSRDAPRDSDEKSAASSSQSSSQPRDNCKLAVESLTIQPLRKFRRHLSAVFRRARDPPSDKRPIDIMVLDESESPRVVHDLPQEATPEEDLLQPLKLYLGSVIIGPLIELPDLTEGVSAIDGGPVAAADEDFATEESHLEGQHTTAEGPRDNSDSGSQSGSNLWLIMTLVLLVALIIALIILLVKMQRGQLANKHLATVMNNPHHQSSIPDIKLMTQ